jgi:tripartite-type tricarboxylate transporter receptor subunit TctC
MKRLLLASLSALVLLPVLAPAHAQTPWPNERPITLVVPFAPGGGTDILARLMAEKLGADLGQTIVIDNKPGANGALALRAVERAKPDGYTLMFGSSSTHVLAPLMSEDKKAMDDVRSKSALASMVADTPLVLAVRAGSDIKTLGQLLQKAKTRPVNFGTFGSGSSPHVLGELLAARTGTQLLHVAYKGSSPAVTDLRGGHIDSVFLTVAAVSAQVEAREVLPLAVTGPRRVATLPDVPTFQESGITGLEDSGWFAVFAPTSTPAPVLDRLHAGIAKVMTQPAMGVQLQELGLQHVPGSRAQDVQAWERSITQTRKTLQQVRISTQ